ncbi:MAG: hypothetical protein EP343_02675 [Deltaproteobacteria bacterium]|nr:MAG: hypothetical protein EP343_02675 [Deltaproteobacteria bacterium]
MQNLRWLACLLVLVASCAGASVTWGQSSCPIQKSSLDWFTKAKLLANKGYLAKAFRKVRYRRPRRSFALVAKVVEGAGQPAFQYYSLGDTGFVPSPRKFWPASTIKIWSALSALMTLKQYGATGESQLSLFDPLGVFAGTAQDLMKEITNENYDRLTRIAGLQSLSEFSERKKYGLPNLVVQRGYAGGSVRRSPKIRFLESGRVGVIPTRRWSQRNPNCRSNCTTLFEIQEIVRRVGLHHELPVAERFPIYASDATRWKTSMLTYWKWIQEGVEAALGKGAKIYNKAGSVPGNHFLDNAFVDSDLGRFLVTVASPWPRRHYTVDYSLRNLNELARQSLNAILGDPKARPILQADSGLMLVAVKASSASSRQFSVEVKGADIVNLTAWLGQQRLRVRRVRAGTFRVSGSFRGNGKRILVFQGYAGGQLIAYRSVGVDVPFPGDKWKCY